MNFSAQKYASHATAVVIDDVIIIGRRQSTSLVMYLRLLRKYITREVLM